MVFAQYVLQAMGRKKQVVVVDLLSLASDRQQTVLVTHELLAPDTAMHQQEFNSSYTVVQCCVDEGSGGIYQLQQQQYSSNNDYCTRPCHCCILRSSVRLLK